MVQAHNTALYILGTGILKFDRFDSDGNPQGLRDLGSCKEFKMTPAEETKEHTSYRGEVAAVDLEVAQRRKLTVSFILDEYDKDTLKLALFGQEAGYAIRPMTAGDIRGQLDFAGMNTQGPRYHAQLWRVKLKNSGDINLITDDWGEIAFEGTIESDETNHPDEPYGLLTPLGDS